MLLIIPYSYPFWSSITNLDSTCVNCSLRFDAAARAAAAYSDAVRKHALHILSLSSSRLLVSLTKCQLLVVCVVAAYGC